VTGRAFWPPAEAAQADYEMLRAQVLACGSRPGRPRPGSLAAAWPG